MAEYTAESLTPSQTQQVFRAKMNELNAQGVMVKQRVDNNNNHTTKL